MGVFGRGDGYWETGVEGSLLEGPLLDCTFWAGLDLGLEYRDFANEFVNGRSILI